MRLRTLDPIRTALVTATLASFAQADDLFSSFEFTDLSGQFSLGTAPLDATFTNGEAKTVFNFSLYHTGMNAWMIDEGNTGTVDFGQAPARVDFFLKSATPASVGQATVRDPQGVVLGIFAATDTGWTQVTVDGPIGTIEIQNASPAGAGYVVIDDLTVNFGITTTYCTGKPNSQGCTPAIGATGVPSMTSASPFTIDAQMIVNNKAGILFYGQSGRAAIPFQGGFLCVQPPTRRTPLQGSAGNPPPNDCSGSFAFDFNTWAQSGADPSLSVGSTIHAQYWYRDPQSPSTTGLSNGLEFVICN